MKDFLQQQNNFKDILKGYEMMVDIFFSTRLLHKIQEQTTHIITAMLYICLNACVKPPLPSTVLWTYYYMIIRLIMVIIEIYQRDERFISTLFFIKYILKNIIQPMLYAFKTNKPLLPKWFTYMTIRPMYFFSSSQKVIYNCK